MLHSFIVSHFFFPVEKQFTEVLIYIFPLYFSINPFLGNLREEFEVNALLQKCRIIEEIILGVLEQKGGEGNGTQIQYSCLENPMDRGAWQAAVHGVTKSWTRLSNFTFTFHFHALEKEMATHSSVLAWRIPTVEPDGLLSMGLHRVGHY